MIADTISVTIPVTDVAPIDRVVLMAGPVDLSTVDERIWEANRVLETADGAPGRLVVDLGDVTFMDSTGVGALIAIRNLAHSRNHPLFLRRTPPRISRLISMTGLGQILPELEPSLV